MKRRKNKKNNIKNIISILSLLCALTAVILITLVGVYFFDDDTDVAFVSGSDGATSQSDTTEEEKITEEQTTLQKPSFENEVTKPSVAQTTTEKSTVPPSTTATAQSDKYESDRIIINPDQEKWNLVVVNSSREMPEGYVPKLDEIYDTGVYMDYRVTPHYEKMYSAAKKDGIILTPYSGYRSYDRQKRNYNNLTDKYMGQYNLSRSEAAKKAATVILPPGTSEHNLGLAMDICNTYDSFANQKEYRWLTEHAHEYGFILRYTAEKKSITGIVAEPWHWRYVGVEYAEKIKNSELCLEEYLDSIGVTY